MSTPEGRIHGNPYRGRLGRGNDELSRGSTSHEGFEDEEVKSPAPTRCAKCIKAVWSYVVIACS